MENQFEDFEKSHKKTHLYGPQYSIEQIIEDLFTDVLENYLGRKLFDYDFKDIDVTVLNSPSKEHDYYQCKLFYSSVLLGVITYGYAPSLEQYRECIRENKKIFRANFTCSYNLN